MKPTLVQQYLGRLQLLSWVSHEWIKRLGRALKLSTSMTRVSMTSPHSKQWPSSVVNPDSGREMLPLSSELKPLRERTLLLREFSLDSPSELHPPELLLCTDIQLAHATALRPLLTVGLQQIVLVKHRRSGLEQCHNGWRHTLLLRGMQH